jgi:hypothetical protein
LNGLDFLRLVLPPTGWYVGFAKKGDERRHQSFPTILALHAWLLRHDADGFDVYYAVASFKEAFTRHPVTQKIQRRTHANVALIGSLFGDVDTRESKANAPYADREEAAQAVVAFCRAEKLPSPLWVSSGGGLHIYWPLSVAVVLALALALAEWHVYAIGLKRAALAFGLHLDPTRTADASSILRVPGTHHHRTGRLVQASSEIARVDPSVFEHLKRHTDEQDRRRLEPAPPARNDSPIAAAMLGDLGDAPSDPNLMRRGCAQIRRVAEKPGAYGEPLNRLVAGACKNCGPGGDVVYLSWLDPDWRATGRDYFERWSVGPPWCATFESLNPGGCDGCAIRGEGKTPLWWGRQAERTIARISTVSERSRTPQQETAEQTTQGLNGFPILGPRWGFDQNNRLCEVTEDKKGHPVHMKVSEHPIYVSGVHASEVLEKTSYTFKHYLPNEGWTEINVPGSSMGNGRGIPELMDNGVIIHNPKVFTEYMNEQIGEFNRVPGQRRSIKYEQCGWKGRDYLAGGLLFRSNGGVERVVTSDEIAARVKLGLGPVAGGNARVWVSITNQLFSLDHYCAWFNIGASLGSMFMPWHSRTEGGVIVSNFTPESGKGKTRIAQACAAIWGLWNALTIKDYDTAASQGLILACLNNIPFFVDELGHFARHPQFGVVHLREFLDKHAAGTDKHRALQHGMGIRHQLGTWCNTGITTTNQPILDLVDSQGGLLGNAPGMRIGELDATPPRTFDTQLGDQLEPHLWLNAGHVGQEFLKHVVRPDIYQAAHKALGEFTAQLWAYHKLGSEQRFRVRLVSTAQLGLMLGQDKGLVPRGLDIGAVVDWAMSQFRVRTPAPSGHAKLDMATEVLGRFLHVNILNTLRVQHAYRAHVQQAVFGQKPQKLVVRHESESQRVYAVQKEFRTFVIANGFPYAAIINELKQQRIIKDDKRMVTLGAGTEYFSVQVPCIEFDGSHPIFSSMLQEVPHVTTGIAGEA